MAYITILKEDHSVDQLKAFLKQSKDEVQKTRLRILICIRKGTLRKHVADEFGVHIDTVANTITRYNEQGIDGLRVNKGGRKEGNPKWDTEIFSSLVKEIDKQDKYWSIPVMIKWIKEKYKKDIPEQTVWYHIDKQGYSYKSARPHPYKGDKEKQEAFKKGA